MSIQECLEIITKTNIFAITAPAWAWNLPFPWSVWDPPQECDGSLFFDIYRRIRRTRRAYDTMRAFMRTVVSTTRETIRSEAEDVATKRARDLFSLLIRASEDAGGKIGLSDNELVSMTLGHLVPRANRFPCHRSETCSLFCLLVMVSV